MARVRMYTTRWCAYCVRAKALLEARGIDYEEIAVDDDPRFRHTLLELAGSYTVPQLLLDGRPIGGYAELYALAQRGELDELLAA